MQTNALTGENIKTIFTNSVKKLLDTKISTVDTNRLVKVDVERGDNVNVGFDVEIIHIE